MKFFFLDEKVTFLAYLNDISKNEIKIKLEPTVKTSIGTINITLTIFTICLSCVFEP